MPIQVQLPDGSIAEFPDGTPRQVMESALAQHRDNWKPVRRSPEDLKRLALQDQDRHPATDGMSTAAKVAAGAGKSLMDTYQGLQQLGGDIGGMVAPGLVANQRAQLQGSIDTRKGVDDALMNTKAGIAGNVLGVGAQMLAPGADAGKLVSYAGRGATMLRGAVSGGAFAGSQPVATGETRAGNVAKGAAFGALGAKVADVAGAAANSTWGRLAPEMQTLVAKAKAAGIPIHFSQLSDSKFVKTLASTLSYLPFSGGGAKAEAQQKAFNAAIGRGLGAKDATALTDDVMQVARNRLGGVYDAIFHGRSVALDSKALHDLVSLHSAAGQKLESEQARVAKNQIERIMDEAAKNGGAIPGEVYQSLRGALRKDFPGTNRLDSIVKDARRILDESAARSLGPSAAKALQKVNAAYANFKTAETVLKQVPGAAGNVRPAALWPAVRNGSTKDMRELAKIGQVLLKDPIPDSGTAGRLIAGGAGVGQLGLHGLAALLPLAKMVAVGATVGRAANSEAAANLIASGAANRALQGTGRAIEKAQPQKLLTAAEIALLRKKEKEKR